MSNAIRGYVQEADAEQAVEALAKMSAAKASVIRDGSQDRIPTADVVVGDILALGEGDAIPEKRSRCFSENGCRPPGCSSTASSRTTTVMGAAKAKEQIALHAV